MGGSVLYLDPWSGMSGDMLLAALLDTDRAGGRLEAVLRSSVDALGLEGTTIEVLHDAEWGVACTRIRLDDGGAAPLRHLREMEQVIAGAALSERVRERSLKAARRLAEAEAAVHGSAAEDIHFHEVGAVDTLVDVVGTFALVEALEIGQVWVGVIPVGSGSVEIDHGRMGVPAPATVALLEGYEMVGGPEEGELTTPTGALLVGQLNAVGGGMPAMRPEKVGYGAGSLRLQKGPNLLRVVVGSPAVGTGDADMVVELQTNLDDVSPEIVAHTCARLLEAGAVDVWTVAAQMKKGRPGVVLHALVQMAAETEAMKVLFEESGTLGIRRVAVPRHLAARGIVKVKVGHEEVAVKWGKWGERLVSLAPEYEECAAASSALGLPVKDVIQRAAELARKLVDSKRLVP